MRVGALTRTVAITAPSICRRWNAAAISVVPPIWRICAAPAILYRRSLMRVRLSVTEPKRETPTSIASPKRAVSRAGSDFAVGTAPIAASGAALLITHLIVVDAAH